MIQELAKIATVKAVAEKDLKVLVDGLEVGVHPSTVRVRLVGGITKGKPYKQRVAAAADPWKLLALALSKLNSSSVEALVAEAADLEQVGEDEIKERAKRAIETIVAGTEREVSGRVTAAIQWSLPRMKIPEQRLREIASNDKRVRDGGAEKRAIAAELLATRKEREEYRAVVARQIEDKRRLLVERNEARAGLRVLGTQLDAARADAESARRDGQEIAAGLHEKLHELRAENERLAKQRDELKQELLALIERYTKDALEQAMAKLAAEQPKPAGGWRMKIPFVEVFDMDGQRKVQLGILGTFVVELVKDDAGNRFLKIATETGGTIDPEDRPMVLEAFALSLIEREEDAKEAK